MKTTIFFEDAKTVAKFDSKASGVVVEQKLPVRLTTLGFCIPVVAKALIKTWFKL